MKSNESSLFLFSINVFAVVIIVLASIVSVSAQGYAQSVQGEWTANGEKVRCGTKLAKNVVVKNTSAGENDFIKIADMQGNIVKSCNGDCKVPATGNRETIFSQLYKNVVKWWYGDTESCTIATKGECDNFDGIVVLVMVDGKVSFDNDSIKEFWGENGEITLRDKDNYTVGINEIRIGKNISRILILPKELFDREKQGFNELKKKVRVWKEKEGVGVCSIKSFTQAYIDFVADKYKKELQKYGKTTKAKS